MMAIVKFGSGRDGCYNPQHKSDQSVKADLHYSIDPKRAISETLDGETIIIDLDTGAYYSLNGTGSLFWSGVQSGFSLGQIAEMLGEKYEAGAPAISAAVSGFAALLEADNLIAKAESSAPAARDAAPADRSGTASGPRKPFVSPAREKYTDMQEMLLADPIHDVDASGWPKRKEQR